MDWRDQIAIDSKVLLGKPVIRGTRLSVEFILGLFAQGWSEEEIARNYGITTDQIRACAAYAQESVQGERGLDFRENI